MPVKPLAKKSFNNSKEYITMFRHLCIYSFVCLMMMKYIMNEIHKIFINHERNKYKAMIDEKWVQMSWRIFSWKKKIVIEKNNSMGILFVFKILSFPLSIFRLSFFFRFHKISRRRRKRRENRNRWRRHSFLHCSNRWFICLRNCLKRV